MNRGRNRLLLIAASVALAQCTPLTVRHA